ncbi:hypothetical protein DCC81_19965 [Chitinophaga parva]|uniref:histidine kinase n=1 Tax=Chitinophaga parva TaxID=2169414 RepID=A0A2T7BC87_9BACT|nr:tetratricopeptide repeat-containing sensor histidine kinase [Chitinophaga parva]PUZ22711.1 hypothetical protein DCC81_19965 [Chitinophaga parva]
MSKHKLITRIIWVQLCCLSLSTVHAQSARIKQKEKERSFIKDSIALIDNLNQVGLLYYLEDIDSSFHYAMKARSIAVRLHYPKGITDADNVIATVLLLKGLFKESLELYSKVLVAYQAQADTANAGQVLSNMATAYNTMGDTVKAEMFSRLALQAVRNLKRDSIVSTIYINYCLNNLSLSADSVRYYLDKSREIANRYKDEAMVVLSMQAQADYMIRNGQRQGVLPLISESLSRSVNTGMEYFEINAFWLYGNFYKDVPDSVVHYYKQAYQLIEKMGFSSVKVPILKGILEYTKLSSNKSDTSRIQHLMASVLTTENENLKKFIGDYVRYTAIQDDNQLLEISNRNKQTKIWLLLGAFGVTLALLAVILWQFRVTRLLNKRISEQNSHMQKALSSLEQSQTDNTRIMKIVAHDLRNPIGASFSIADLMLANPNRSAEEKKLLEMMKASCEHSLELVNDLLQLHNRAEELKRESVDVRNLLQYCAELLHFKAAQKGQQIQLQAEPAVAYVSGEKIWRVVSNLITNAIKFSPAGAEILVRLQAKLDVIIISVADNGIGIPPEIKDEIFDMFTRAKRKGTAGEHSFGLGLAISKQIVEAHKGNIWYESNPGKGTIFFVELPVNGII